MQNLYISRVSWSEDEIAETISDIMLFVSDGMNAFEK